MVYEYNNLHVYIRVLQYNMCYKSSLYFIITCWIQFNMIIENTQAEMELKRTFKFYLQLILSLITFI